jgi:hypothetical protein
MERHARTCAHCHTTGKFHKDGKRKEKWRPGPAGPATLCDKYADLLLFEHHPLLCSISYSCGQGWKRRNVRLNEEALSRASRLHLFTSPGTASMSFVDHEAMAYPQPTQMAYPASLDFFQGSGMYYEQLNSRVIHMPHAQEGF